jgi:hypothetical protein
MELFKNSHFPGLYGNDGPILDCFLFSVFCQFCLIAGCNSCANPVFGHVVYCFADQGSFGYVPVAVDEKGTKVALKTFKYFDIKDTDVRIIGFLLNCKHATKFQSIMY